MTTEISTTETPHKLDLRNLRPDDFSAVKEISTKVYKGLADQWTKKEIESSSGISAKDRYALRITAGR